MLTEHAAIALMTELIRGRELELPGVPPHRQPTFADAASAWLHHLEHVKGVKPSTMIDHRYYLAPADAAPRKRGKPPAARIMKKFGHRPLASIGKVEIAHFLTRLDGERGITPRTVNKYRQILHSLFEYATREETFGLPVNPVRGIDRRREPDVTPIDFYEAEEAFALASRKWRAVPLADQPAAALDGLSQRKHFTGRDDLVFCSAVGTHLDGSALRRRYRRAQQAAGLRELRFHDLRHSFGSLIIREFDPVSVKSFMGHAKITTTERYLHARSRRTDALRLTRAFQLADMEDETTAISRQEA